MITFEYCQEGIKVSDFELEECIEYVLEAIESGQLHDGSVVKLSTGLMFDRIRLAIFKGLIDHNKVQFRYNGEDLPIDANARLPRWPVGFNDKMPGILSGLLSSRKK